MDHPIITRFAPSPTGFLHIGGARTALFNWLYAQRMGGRMLLRIEDTDRQRSSAAAIDAIYDGLAWLGLDWQGEAVSQYSRRTRHREIADRLLGLGAAYKCYASAAELAEMRAKAHAAGLPPRYDGRWRERDPGSAPTGIDPVIRFKAPRHGKTEIDDHVQGRIAFANKDLDDLILLRSDGTPTYMLAVVVDDHDMQVSHIIRGDDHLTNAARQVQIYKTLDWPVPQMAHVPLIHGPDGAKLSKRHGALAVQAYREMGYLPDAMRNYLVRLGWSHGDDEIFSTAQLIEWFDLKGIGKSPARFDLAKLDHISGVKIRALGDADLMAAIEALLPHVQGGGETLAALDAGKRTRVMAALPGLKARAKTLRELIDGFGFILAIRPLVIDPAAQRHLQEEGKAVLRALRPVLASLAPWTASAIEGALRDHAARASLKLGQVAQPLRAALTGRTTSPGIFDVLAVLGRDACLARLDDVL